MLLRDDQGLDSAWQGKKITRLTRREQKGSEGTKKKHNSTAAQGSDSGK